MKHYGVSDVKFNQGGVYDEKQMESFIRSYRDHFITYRLWYRVPAKTKKV